MDHSQCICMVTSLVTGSINGDPWAWHTNRDPTKLRGITRINKLLMTAPVAADWWLVPANSVSMCHHVTCADGHNQQQFNILLSIYFQLFLGSYFFFYVDDIIKKWKKTCSALGRKTIQRERRVRKLMYYIILLQYRREWEKYVYLWCWSTWMNNIGNDIGWWHADRVRPRMAHEPEHCGWSSSIE